MGRLLTASSPWHRTVSAGSSAMVAPAVVSSVAPSPVVMQRGLRSSSCTPSGRTLTRGSSTQKRTAGVVRAMRSSAASVPSGFACMVGRCTPCDDAMHTLTSPSSAVHSVAAGTRLAPVSP